MKRVRHPVALKTEVVKQVTDALAWGCQMAKATELQRQQLSRTSCAKI